MMRLVLPALALAAQPYEYMAWVKANPDKAFFASWRSSTRWRPIVQQAGFKLG